MVIAFLVLGMFAIIVIAWVNENRHNREVEEYNAYMDNVRRLAGNTMVEDERPAIRPQVTKVPKSKLFDWATDLDDAPS